MTAARLALLLVLGLPLSSAGQAPARPTPLAASGVARVEPKAGWTRYGHLRAFDILFDRQGTLWAATPDGAYRWNLQTGAYERISPDAANYWGVAEAPDGAIWFTSIGGGGAARYDGKTWKRFGTAEGLPSNEVFDVAFTGAGDAWFSTRAGVTRFDGKTYTTYTTKDGLTTNKCAFVMVAPNGDVWVGNDDDRPEAGVSRFDGRRWTTYTVGTGLKGTTTVPLFAAADGSLWFGTIGEGGVARFDGKDWKHYARPEGLVDNYAEHGIVAPDGALWFSSTGTGVSRFDGARWSTYTQADGLPAKFVYALAFGPDGALWISAMEGLVRYQR